MSATYDALDDRLIAFIRSQKLFFVATAPLSADGCVNVSPKGYESLAIIDPLTLAYLDLGGSGAETLAHVRENGRITLMFCAFEGRANILRLYGRAEICPFDAPGFASRLARFPGFTRARAVVTVRINRIADSCGWGVPFFEFQGEREQLRRHVETGDYEDWARRRFEKNALSIDALPALTPVNPEVE
jgi:hypothetical protein